MPGELDRRSDGKGAMFSVGSTPWHREGEVLKSPPKTVEEALKSAGLDFEVDLQPIFVRSGSGLSEVSDQVATYRTDRGDILGIVGTRYRPLQNRDAFRVLEPLVDKGLAAFETAGSLRGGCDVWMLMRFNVDDPVVRDTFAEEVVPFGLLSNNHAGKRRVMLQETPIRVVCANTLGAAHQTAQKGKAFQVRHTVNVELRTIEAARLLWAALIERYRAVASQYAALRQIFLDDDAFRTLVLDEVAPISDQWLRSRARRQQQKALERARQRRAFIRNLWLEGPGHRGDGSAWEAYNAAVQALDHAILLWPGGTSRVASLLEGSLGAAKQRVLDGLLLHR
jgi:phage/plasmid-like protein (TIGR03299 family)